MAIYGTYCVGNDNDVIDCITDETHHNGNFMLTVMWINISTTAVFIGVFIALVKR